MAISSSFAALKKQNSISMLEKDFAKDSSRSYEDDRQWKPTVDANGNGFAIIRFLPPSEATDDSPAFINYYTHAFKNQLTGKWFIENCPTSIGKPCPVCDKNNILWNTGIESNKAIVRERKRKKRIVSNIYVIQDPKNPENEGKVFLFTYGTKILEMIKACTNPVFPDSKEFSPFDFWEGANFRMKIRNVAKQRSYDSSSFDPPSALSQDDEVLEKIWKCQYDLNSFFTPNMYKDFNILEKRFFDVILEEKNLTGTNTGYSSESSYSDDDDNIKDQSSSSNSQADKFNAFLNKIKEKDTADEDKDLPF